MDQMGTIPLEGWWFKALLGPGPDLVNMGHEVGHRRTSLDLSCVIPGRMFWACVAVLGSGAWLFVGAVRRFSEVLVVRALRVFR